jgi:hypothetical protein
MAPIVWCDEKDSVRMTKLKLSQFLKKVLKANPKDTQYLDKIKALTNNLFDTSFLLCLKHMIAYMYFYVWPLLEIIFRPKEQAAYKE